MAKKRTHEDSYQFKGFSGASSFMSNEYVIYPDGLAGQPPNYYALRQGYGYIKKMFQIRSLDSRSSFSKFVKYLLIISQKEADKERRYLQNKLEANRNLISQEFYNKISTFIEQGNFNAAFTLLYNEEKDLQEWKREIGLDNKHFNNFSHMNQFWKSQFSSYLAEVFQIYTQDITNNLPQYMINGVHKTPSEIVDEFFGFHLLTVKFHLFFLINFFPLLFH